MPFLLDVAVRWGGSAPRLLREDTVRLVIAFYLSLLAAGLVVSLGLLAHARARPIDWAARAREIRKRPWSWDHGFGVVFVLLALHLVIYGVLWLHRTGAALFEEGALMVTQTLVFHWAILILIGVSLARRGISLRAAFGWEARKALKHTGQGILFYLGAMPLMIFYTWVYQALLRHLGYEMQIQDVLRLLMGESATALRVYFILVGVVLAPLSEELLFRGIGLPLLLRRMGPLPAVCLLSFLFAALHLHIPSIIPLFLIGCAFSMAYLYTGSILVPAVMHAVFNGVNLSLMLLMS